MVHLHLQEDGHSFEDGQVYELAREDLRFDRGVKEALHVKLGKPSLSRGGGLRYLQSTPFVNDLNIHTIAQNLLTHHVTLQTKGEALKSETRSTTLLFFFKSGPGIKEAFWREPSRT